MRHSWEVELQENKVGLVSAAWEQVLPRVVGLKSWFYLDTATGVVCGDLGLKEQNQNTDEPERGCHEGLLWEQTEQQVERRLKPEETTRLERLRLESRDIQVQPGLEKVKAAFVSPKQVNRVLIQSNLAGVGPEPSQEHGLAIQEE